MKVSHEVAAKMSAGRLDWPEDPLPRWLTRVVIGKRPQIPTSWRLHRTAGNWLLPKQ